MWMITSPREMIPCHFFSFLNILSATHQLSTISPINLRSGGGFTDNNNFVNFVMPPLPPPPPPPRHYYHHHHCYKNNHHKTFDFPPKQKRKTPFPKEDVFPGFTCWTLQFLYYSIVFSSYILKKHLKK